MISRLIRLGLLAAVVAGTLLLVSPVSQAATHKVVPGDSLWSISRQYETPLEYIWAANRLESYLLEPGREVIIPEDLDDNLTFGELMASLQATGYSTDNEESDGAGDQPVFHVVQVGESLWVIGQKYQVSADDIKAANGLESDLLQLDQVLLIPTEGSAAIAQNRVAVSRGGDRDRDDAVEHAKKYLGVPYRYGGCGPSCFDCSGFTAYIYQQMGQALPHNAASQSGLGRAINKEDLLPGDLVFFGYYGGSTIQHVGIYVGGNRFIHASSSGGVKYSSLAEDYYFKNYKGARRL